MADARQMQDLFEAFKEEELVPRIWGDREKNYQML